MMATRYKLNTLQLTAVAQVYNRMDPVELQAQDPDLYALAQALGKFIAGNLAMVDVLPAVGWLEIDIPDDPSHPARVTVSITHKKREYRLTTDGAGRLPPFPWRTEGRKRGRQGGGPTPTR